MPFSSTQSVVSLARKFKGAPLAILWVLIFNNQRVSQKYLISLTGYTDKTVTSALQFLETEGLVNRQYNGYQLTQALQLPLLLDADPENFSEKSENFRPLVISNYKDKNNLTLNTTNNNRRKNSETWIELEAAGVYRNQTTERLALTVSADQVRAMVRKLTAEGKPMPANAGLLIKRLATAPHEMTDEERRHKYGEWED